MESPTVNWDIMPGEIERLETTSCTTSTISGSSSTGVSMKFRDKRSARYIYFPGKYSTSGLNSINLSLIFLSLYRDSIPPWWTHASRLVIVYLQDLRVLPDFLDAWVFLCLKYRNFHVFMKEIEINLVFKVKVIKWLCTFGVCFEKDLKALFKLLPVLTGVATCQFDRTWPRLVPHHRVDRAQAPAKVSVFS
ncbi:Halomucin, partial [Frankliniella fusca]